MLKMLRRLGAILALVTLSISRAHAEGYVGQGTIAYLQNGYGQWILITNGANSNPDNCSVNIVMLERTHLQYKELYALLLSAYLAQKNVNIYVSGCHSAGYKLLSFVGTTS